MGGGSAALEAAGSRKPALRAAVMLLRVLVGFVAPAGPASPRMRVDADLPWPSGRNSARPDSAQPPRGLAMDYPNDEWQRKGATLSDKTAREEFGLTQDEIYDAIDAGTLHYRQAAMHGNPWLRLLRREVEALARTSHGDRYVNERQDKAELARVDREIRRLRAELAALGERRSKLSSDLGK